DAVRDRQQPLDQPKPAAQRLVEAASYHHGVALVHGFPLAGACGFRIHDTGARWTRAEAITRAETRSPTDPSKDPHMHGTRVLRGDRMKMPMAHQCRPKAPPPGAKQGPSTYQALVREPGRRPASAPGDGPARKLLRRIA